MNAKSRARQAGQPIFRGRVARRGVSAILYIVTTKNSAALTQASDLAATRAVHSAMAASVRDRGTTQSQALYDAARALNETHFGGVLTAILVEITAPSSPRALATHQPKTPEGVDCVIRIAPSVVEAGDRLAQDVLLHEMIHVWQAETDNREPGYAGHGPKFAAMCNAIGSTLGLAPVGVKGRGGLPDCAQWPLNVRPEGYYGEAVRATKAVASATKAPRTAVKKVKTPKPARGKRPNWKALAKAYRARDVRARDLLRTALDMSDARLNPGWETECRALLGS